MFEKHPNSIPNTIFIVGCGGTGSRIVPLVAQFIKTLRHVIDPKIVLMDFDNVEEKNLLRQNFIRPDIGKNKAVVLAERYSRAYDINIVPVTKKISPNGTRVRDILVKELAYTAMPVQPLILMCVDSAQARRDVLHSFVEINQGCNPLYLDSGNEDGYGQVIMFNPEFLIDGNSLLAAMASLPPFIPTRSKIMNMPCDIKLYATMQDLATGSCADLDQTLAINSLMASTMMGIIQNHYYVRPINYNRVNVTLDGCSYANILNVKNFTSLSIGAGTVGESANWHRTATSWGFRGTRTDDFILNLYNAIKAEEKAAVEIVKAAKAKAAKAAASSAVV